MGRDSSARVESTDATKEMNTKLAAMMAERESTEATKEMNTKLAAMMAERERQDKTFASVALSEKEYEAKYGGQPEAHAKK